MRIINVPLLYLFYLLDFLALFYISQKKWNCDHSSPPLGNAGRGGGGGGGEAEPFFRGGNFFLVRFENSLYKKS